MSILELCHHEAGEYRFTPDRLTLSVSLGPPLPIEQFWDRPWTGTALRGDVKVMVPGQQRIFRHRRGCDFACLYIDEAAPPLRPRVLLRDAALIHVIEALLAEVQLGPATRLFEDAAAQAILARLATLEGTTPQPPRHRLGGAALSRVLEFLDAHLTEDISVEDLARVANLSVAHFATMFRNSIGEPPHRYQIRLRVERAQQLLRRGAAPLDAALALGFYDQSHLTRHMRRLLGVTPGAIARSSKNRRNVQDGQLVKS